MVSFSSLADNASHVTKHVDRVEVLPVDVKIFLDSFLSVLFNARIIAVVFCHNRTGVTEMVSECVV